MDEPKPRPVLFDCLVCLNPSYLPEPEVDFGTWGKFKIPVCGGCMQTGDKDKIISVAVYKLTPFIPPKLIEARMEDVLVDYREPLRQGA